MAMEIDVGPEPVGAPAGVQGRGRWVGGREGGRETGESASGCSLGLAAWEEYPTLKMLMEMVMTK